LINNAVASGGRLTSVVIFFHQADGRRIATDSQLGNVMATAKGTDPQMTIYD
jgi:hypothetical protein